MALTGRKPTPASLISAIDHKKAKADIGIRKQAEEQLKTAATLVCPKHLSEEARREWRRVMKLYRSMETDILCDLDTQALVMYCEATAIYRKAQETWVKYQQVVTSNHEAQKVLDKCFALMERQTNIVKGLSEQLCLTPIGRARMGMNANKSKEPSKLAMLLGGDDD